MFVQLSMLHPTNYFLDCRLSNRILTACQPAVNANTFSVQVLAQVFQPQVWRNWTQSELDSQLKANKLPKFKLDRKLKIAKSSCRERPNDRTTEPPAGRWHQVLWKCQSNRVGGSAHSGSLRQCEGACNKANAAWAAGAMATLALELAHAAVACASLS